MKIVQIIPTIASEVDGPGRIVRTICLGLADRNNDVRLHLLTPHTPSDFGRVTLQVHSRSSFAPSLGISPSMAAAIRRDAREADILHTHGMWMMQHLYPARAVALGNAKLVHSPRGTLASNALAFHGLRKRAAWWLFQKWAAGKADLFHATAEKEVSEMRDFGIRQPIALIPNGVDLPALKLTTRKKRVLCLGRIHPMKGLEPLVRAWASLEKKHPDWELWLVGESQENHGDYLERLSRNLGVRNLKMPGPMRGAEKQELLATAGLGAYPSLTENFGNAIAETLAHGVPVVASVQTPWGSTVEARQCGWSHTEETLLRQLDAAISTSAERRAEMGRSAREWLLKEFNWNGVISRFETSYRWLIDGGQAPAWIDRTGTSTKSTPQRRSA